MEEKKAPKKRLGLKKEAPEAFMASFFAGLEVYQTKMLVRCFPHSSFKITTVTLSTNTNLLDIKTKMMITITFSQNYLARNFYNLRFLALFVAFAINFILLFYKVSLELNYHFIYSP